MRTNPGNAEYFAVLHGDDVRFDHRLGRWIVWSETKKQWRVDQERYVLQLAKQAMRHRLRAADHFKDKETVEKERKWAVASENKLTPLLEHAQSQHPLSDSGDGWNQDPWLLGVANGILNLKTGKLREGKPEDRISKFSAVPFLPDALCPRWDSFLLEITSGDSMMVDFLERALGSSLTGDVSEQKVFFPFGPGGNGKTTLLEVMLHILGEGIYAAALEPSVLEQKRQTMVGDNMVLVGARFVKATETREGVRLNEGKVKEWSGGDTLSARPFYAEWFNFRPTHKLWFAFNHKPIITDLTPAMWRRVVLIPFDRNFDAEGKKDTQLGRKLEAEAPGILNRLVAGCLKWQREGLAVPPRVREATGQYEKDSNPLKPFLEDRCLLSTSGSVSVRALKEEYRNWCEEQGEQPVKGETFNRTLEACGPRLSRNANGRFWVCLVLRPNGER